MQWFNSNQTLIQTALIYIILGYSLQIPLRAGVFSFASGGFYGFGAYTVGILVKNGTGPVVSTLIAMVVAGIIGLGLSLILSKLKSLYLAMATLAFIFLVKLVGESLPITGKVIGLLGVPKKLGTWHLAVIVIVVTVVVWLMSRGRLARITETMRTDEMLAGTIGMSVLRQRHVVFVISSVLGALSGGLFVLTFTLVIPDRIGFDLMLTALTILVIGGSRHALGVVIGAAVVAWIPQWLTAFGQWRPVAQGVVIVAIAVFASNGVTGIMDSTMARMRRRRIERDSGVPLSAPDVGATTGPTMEVSK